jgi:hypothetical protein
VAHVYKALWTVEDMIRTAKSILKTIYHKCNQTIRGHVFCSCLALLLKTERRSTSSSGAKRDAGAAERFLLKVLGGKNRPARRVINTDKDAAYPPAIVQLKAEGALEENCRHRLSAVP